MRRQKSLRKKTPRIVSVNALYRLAWLILDQDAQFINIPADAKKMPLSEKFLDTYASSAPAIFMWVSEHSDSGNWIFSHRQTRLAFYGAEFLKLRT